MDDNELNETFRKIYGDIHELKAHYENIRENLDKLTSIMQKQIELEYRYQQNASEIENMKRDYQEVKDKSGESREVLFELINTAKGVKIAIMVIASTLGAAIAGGLFWLTVELMQMRDTVHKHEILFEQEISSKKSNFHKTLSTHTSNGAEIK